MIAAQQLVDEIRLLLQTPDQQQPEQVRRLGVMYNSACQETNLRLHRCGDLLARGLRSEAIHMAQAEPVLLDVVAALDFPERKPWEQLCAARGVPQPPPLNLETATMLNEAYADDQPVEELLRKHRLLALGRAPLPHRLALLRRLCELEPRNLAWEEDIRTFERARIQQLQNDLDFWIQRMDVQAVMRAATELTTANWRLSLPPSLVTKARNAAKQFEGMRSLAVLKDIEVKLNDAMSAFDVPRALALRDQWNRVLADFKPPPTDPIWARMAVVLGWVQQQAQRQGEATAYMAATAELELLLDQQKPLVQLETAYAKLMNFGRGVPDALQTRYQTAVRHIRTAKRWRTVRRIAAAILIIGGAAGGGVWYWNHNAEGEKVQLAVRTVEQFIETGQFSEAGAYLEQLERSEPHAAGTRPVQDVKLRLQKAEKEEQDRLALFKESLREAEDAPLNATGDRTVDRAKDLARLPEEISAVGRLVRERKRKTEETRLSHEKSLLPKVEQLAKEVQQLEDMLKQSYDPAAIARQISKDTRSLTQLTDEAAAASGSAQDQLKALAGRLDAARDQVQKSNAEVFAAEAITSALLTQTTVAAYAEAVEKYLKRFPETHRSKDFKRALTERRAWESVLAWKSLVEPVVARPLDMSTKDAANLGEQLKKFVQDHPHSPDRTLLDNYVKALDAIGKRDGSVPNSALGEYRKIFGSLVVRDVWMLRADDGRAYYSTENLKEKVRKATQGRVSFECLVGYNGQTRRALRLSKTVSQVGLSPQSTLADGARGLTDPAAEKNWEEELIKVAKKLRDETKMDPILQMILLRQILECGGQGSLPLAEATAGLLQEIEKSRIDVTVPWLDPDNEAAKRQRPPAREFINQLPTFDRLLKDTNERKQRLADEVASSRRVIIGWLAREKSNRWEVASIASLPENCDLYVVVRNADETTNWQRIGQSVKGKTSVSSAKPDALVEGRLVFAAKKTGN